MKRLISLIFATILLTLSANGQHFYHRLEINTGNLYSFVASNLITAGANKLTTDRLFDNSFAYTVYNVKDDETKYTAKDYNRIGLSIRDLFSDCSFGAKLGYQSFSPGIFNWGLFASGHYRINQFKLNPDNNEEYSRHNIQYWQLGGGIMLAFGAMSSGSKIVFEAGLRYNIPAYYKGAWGTDKSHILSHGISSHYSLRIGGFGPLQGIGVFADIPHSNWINNQFCNDITSLKGYTFGLTYTILPWDIN